MEDIIYKDSIVHLFLAFYINRYTKNMIMYEGVEKYRLKDIPRNILNKITKISIDIDILDKGLESCMNGSLDNMGFDLYYDRNILLEILDYYGFVNIDTIYYVLDISNRLNYNLRAFNSIDKFIEDNIYIENKEFFQVSERKKRLKLLKRIK